MTNPLTTTAIIGTGQQDTPEIATGTQVDRLAAQLTDAETERKLLLTAGAWAAYRRAGSIAQPSPPLPAPAPQETRTVCTQQAAHLLESLLQNAEKYGALLPEAVTLLKQAGLRLPHRLLPAFLDYATRAKALRPLLLLVLGERGRWLSQFNSAWSWVNDFLADEQETLPDDAETIWQEGTVGQRAELLRRLRSVDPARARDWLAATWKQEKVEARGKFLSTLEVGLAIEDEPLLEKALDDRGESVRSLAVSLLARLTASALAQRMRERADSMLDFVKSKQPFAKGKLQVTPPDQLEKDWQRDGISARLPKNSAYEKAQEWWLAQVLAYVPPEHWTQRFTTSATELIIAASNSGWSGAIIRGWTSAAQNFNAHRWYMPLYTWWLARKNKWKGYDRELLLFLLKQVAYQHPEKLLALLETDNLPQEQIEEVLEALPRSWSREFSTTILHRLRTYPTSLIMSTKYNTSYYYYYTFQKLLTRAAIAIPPDCFEAACTGWQLPESQHWAASSIQQSIEHFIEQINMRKLLREEIR